MTVFCSKCSSRSDVFDSRIRDGTTFRRRECKKCGHRWTTKEIDARNTEKRVSTMERKRLAYAMAAIERFLNQ